MAIPDNYIIKETNKKICFALNCSSIATETIKVKAGKFGEIPLQLCKNCVSKFIE